MIKAECHHRGQRRIYEVLETKRNENQRKTVKRNEQLQHDRNAAAVRYEEISELADQRHSPNPKCCRQKGYTKTRDHGRKHDRQCQREGRRKLSKRFLKLHFGKSLLGSQRLS